MRATIGIIGGSGLYDMDGFENIEELHIDTPFGAPSDALRVGTLDGIPTAFLPRHGRNHRFAPHEINYRANLWALKSLGVRWVISVSAVGSLSESIHPGDLVVVDQLIDRTRARPSTFFEDGIVAHVPLADPVCPVLAGAVQAALATLPDLRWHPSGTYVCIDGPQFSTRAESFLYRSWGASVVGMTNLPEARLAREAELAYATLAMATDYDCWHAEHDSVTVDQVVATMKANIGNAQRALRAVVARIAALPSSPTWTALDFAVMTAPDAIPAAARARLGLLLERIGLAPT